MSCVTTADCAEVTDGCCTQWTIESFAEDSYWGGFSAIWGGDEAMEVGASFSQCQSAAYAEARDALTGEEEFAGSNYEDLGIFLATAPEEVIESLGLFPEDTVDDMIAAWDGDVYTQQNFMIGVACVVDMEEGANALVAASATLFAAALLM